MKSVTVPVGVDGAAWELRDSTGTLHRLDEIEGDKVVLVFFRGFWCESCQAQLELMTAEYQEIVDRGAVTVAISADSADARWSGGVAAVSGAVRSRPGS